MDQQTIDEMHYLPANHVMAAYLTGGAEGAQKEAQVNAQAIRSDTAEPVLLLWADWYEKTCLAIIDRLDQEDPTWKTYLPFNYSKKDMAELAKETTWKWANEQADRLTPEDLQEMIAKFPEHFVFKDKKDIERVNATTWGTLITLITEGKVIDLPQRFALDPQKQLMPLLKKNIRVLWLMRWLSSQPHKTLYKKIYPAAKKILKGKDLVPGELHDFYWNTFMLKKR